MRKMLAPAAIVAALLLASCSTGDTEPAADATTASSEAESTPTQTSQSKKESEEELKDALTAPTEQPEQVPAANVEDAFLKQYKQELKSLPEGPHEQLGTDAQAVELGYRVCEDLTVMSYGEALTAYAFDLEVTEEQVADYNAALNAAIVTLCPE
jgi:hypothetical protein